MSVLAPEASSPDLPAASDASPLESRESRHQLLSAVEALPETLREIVMLYYYNDLTYQDLAELLGVSAATVNARLTQARATLRERLNAAGSRS